MNSKVTNQSIYAQRKNIKFNYFGDLDLITNIYYFCYMLILTEQ